jgi:hypothetical protein
MSASPLVTKLEQVCVRLGKNVSAVNFDVVSIIGESHERNAIVGEINPLIGCGSSWTNTSTRTSLRLCMYVPGNQRSKSVSRVAKRACPDVSIEANELG